MVRTVIVATASFQFFPLVASSNCTFQVTSAGNFLSLSVHPNTILLADSLSIEGVGG